MSASTRSAQQTMGTGRMGVALVAVALAIVLAGVIAFGQLLATKAQTAPAAGLAPAAVIDHGSRSEIGAPAAIKAPVLLDRGSRFEATKNTSGSPDDRSGAASGASGGGPRLRAQ
jgi:hypothetical protein